MKIPINSLIILSISFMTFSGCATTQSTRFYLLSSLAKSAEQPRSYANASTNTQDEESTLSLGIGPINIPKYLDRRQIVTRSSRNTLRLSEFHNWAEQLKNNFTQVMAENLSILLGTNQVEPFPWQRQHAIDYQLVMNVIQFEQTTDGKALLIARWSLLDGEGKTILANRKSHITAKPSGQDYESLVKALSTAILNISREIAEDIKHLPLE